MVINAAGILHVEVVEAVITVVKLVEGSRAPNLRISLLMYQRLSKLDVLHGRLSRNCSLHNNEI